MKMNQSNLRFLVMFLATALCSEIRTNAQMPRLVSTIVVFGDSIGDVGNNNYLSTLFKANYLPYGRDFNTHAPTGRFCNGKVAIDIIADLVGLRNNYPPPYLSPNVSRAQLLNGVNFASSGSGYDDQTAIFNHAIPLLRQLEYYKKYHGRLARVVGRNRARAIRNDTLFIVAAGSSDFVLNYYINPLVYIFHTPSKYSSYLVEIFSRFIKDLYRLGARKIGVTSLPPIGCLPLVITLFGYGNQGCVELKNADAREFNMMMNKTMNRLKRRFPELKMELFDIYTPLYNLVQHPSTNGFTEARKGCCGMGMIETTSLLCNPISIGTCTSASKYVFWDSVHPSETTNQYIVNTLRSQALRLIA